MPASQNTDLLGVQINYFLICPRKLWLFSHGITMEHTSDLVKSGAFLHERVLPSYRRELLLERVKIDRVHQQLIYEIKRSPRMEKAHRFQLLYILHILKQHGVNLTGQLCYPKNRKIVPVKLEPKNEKTLLEIITEIKKTLSLPQPPPPSRKKYCKKCSYFPFCWC